MERWRWWGNNVPRRDKKFHEPPPSIALLKDCHWCQQTQHKTGRGPTRGKIFRYWFGGTRHHIRRVATIRKATKDEAHRAQ